MSDAIRPYEPRDAEGAGSTSPRRKRMSGRWKRSGRRQRRSLWMACCNACLPRACRERRGVVLVAEADGVVAGFVCCFMMTITNPITTLSDCAYVADVAVLEPYRRRGLGRALLRAAEEHAASQGATTIRIEVLAANGPACNLYEAKGYRPFEMLLTKPLAHGED